MPDRHAIAGFRDRWTVSVGALAIAVLAVVAFIPAIRGGFIWDDDAFLTANRLIRAPDGLFRFWFSSEAVDYWPVTSSSLWIEWRLWGAHPMGYHVTNVLLHIGECWLLWSILRALRMPGAFAAALLFAVHPLNAESVAWITQRKNLMAMLFYLASIRLFIAGGYAGPRSGSAGAANPLRPGGGRPDGEPRPGPGAGSQARRAYGLSLAAFVLAMLSKGSVAMLPVVLAGLIAWRRPLRIADGILLAPYAAIAGALTLVNLSLAAHGPADEIRVADLLHRALGAGAVVWFYLGKSLIPVRQMFVYPMWEIRATDVLWWLPSTGVIALTGVLWFRRKSWGRAPLFAWGYFCASLVPVMGFADVYFMKYSLVSDHYAHIALIGVVAIIAYAGTVAAGRTGPAGLWAGRLALAVVACSFAGLSWNQSRNYGDLERLYRETLRLNPAAWMAHNNLGGILRDSGRLAEADAEYRIAEQQRPLFPGAHFGRGLTLAAQGREAEAEDELREAIRLSPLFAEARINLADLLRKRGRPEDAVAQLRMVLRAQPSNAAALSDLALMDEDAGRTAEALAGFAAAIAADPSFGTPRAALGAALAHLGRFDEAMACYEDAARAAPNDAQWPNRIGQLLAQRGRVGEAIARYREALRVDPTFAAADNNLGIALAQLGRVGEAVGPFAEAVRLSPGFYEARMNLAQALRVEGRTAEAAEQFEIARRLRPR